MKTYKAPGEIEYDGAGRAYKIVFNYHEDAKDWCPYWGDSPSGDWGPVERGVSRVRIVCPRCEKRFVSRRVMVDGDVLHLLPKHKSH